MLILGHYILGFRPLYFWISATLFWMSVTIVLDLGIYFLVTPLKHPITYSIFVINCRVSVQVPTPGRPLSLGPRAGTLKVARNALGKVPRRVVWYPVAAFGRHRVPAGVSGHFEGPGGGSRGRQRDS